MEEMGKQNHVGSGWFWTVYRMTSTGGCDVGGSNVILISMGSLVVESDWCSS